MEKQKSDIYLFLDTGKELGFKTVLNILQLQLPFLKKGNCHIYFDNNKNMIKLEQVTKKGILQFEKVINKSKNEKDFKKIIKKSIIDLVQMAKKCRKMQNKGG